MEKQYRMYLQEYKEMLKYWKQWKEKECRRYEEAKKLELKR